MELLWEIKSQGLSAVPFPDSDVPPPSSKAYPPKKMIRTGEIGLPSVSEVDVMRHFVNLSTMNHHLDKGFYPLGSCTMKYNPKVNERVATLPGFTGIHPLIPEKFAQGALELMFELGQMLCEIGGMDDITLQPAAGAQGELTGLLTIREYLADKGDARKYAIIPDSAHGTNPASIHFAGWKPISIRSNDEGMVDPEALKEVLNDETAVLMLTNPNTLGIFEREILRIADMVHSAGAQLYMDGANMNALLGRVRPGDLGFDAMHYNLHKTFSTPHGGGGPGSGPVAVKAHLADFLPIPTIIKDGDEYKLDFDRPKSLGRVQAFWGAFLVMVKAYTYLRILGADGIKNVSEGAVINANYLKHIMSGNEWELGYKGVPLHEFVLDGESLKEKYGVKTLDVAKRLLDFGFHAPTVYFPLIVHEALMIEPTETESKETLEAFADAMKKIAREAAEAPAALRSAPQKTPVRRLDDVKAIKESVLSFWDIAKEG